MPNAKVLTEKKKIVEELTGKLKSQAGVFVDYSGISVNEDTEMRVKMREANVDYTVIKNTLMRFAINNVGFEELDPILNGTTSLAVCNDDPIAPARLTKEYADKFNGFFEIKGGFMDGKVLSAADVNKIAGIPALPVLQAQLLGTMLAPITALAVVLKAIAEKSGAPADAQISESAAEPTNTEVAQEAVAEAPAEAVAQAPEGSQPEAEADPPAETVPETATETPAEAVAPIDNADEAPSPEASETETTTEAKTE